MGVWTEYGEALQAYANHPVEFVRDEIGATPDAWQEDALLALAESNQVAVAGCTGSGKDTLAAWSILWFVATRPFAKLPCTAPSQYLLHDVLWSEIHKWLRVSGGLQRVLEWRNTELVHRSHPEEWFAIARTAVARRTDDGTVQVEGLAGKHADHLLAVVDEGSGVIPEFFDALEATLTGPDNKILVVGNPVRGSGRFWEIFNKPAVARAWRKFYVGAIESDRIPRSDSGMRYVSDHASVERAQTLIDSYGENSLIVEARVFARFPTTSTVDTQFTAPQVQAAFGRTYDPTDSDVRQIGVDCARFGDDETVIYIRHGWRARAYKIAGMSSAVEIAAWTIEAMNLLAVPGKDGKLVMPPTLVDGAGGGGGSGVVDILWAQGYENVVEVHFGGTPQDEESYLNVSSEMWLGDLAEAMPYLDLDEDDELLRQLVTRKYKYTGLRAQRRVETKDEMKRRKVGSPDRAEALCLAFAKPPSVEVY